MKLFEQWLEEANIAGMRNVKVIRHYTTGKALKQILSTGIIKANESIGDRDWAKYDKPYKDSKVVSFLDARSDYEMGACLDANKSGTTLEYNTKHLGLHSREICACIEIDYDKLLEEGNGEGDILRAMRDKGIDQVDVWNKVIENFDENSKYILIGKEFIEAFRDSISKDTFCPVDFREPLSSNGLARESHCTIPALKDLFDDFCLDNNIKDKEMLAKAVEALYNGMFHKHSNDSYHEMKKEDFFYSLDNLEDDFQKYKSRNMREFNRKEEKEFIEAYANLDFLKCIKILRDINFTYYKPKENSIDLLKTIASMIDIFYKYEIDNLVDMFASGKKARYEFCLDKPIEIRIPYDVKLTKDNCRIIIFEEMLEASYEGKSWHNFVFKKDTNRYNIDVLFLEDEYKKWK